MLIKLFLFFTLVPLIELTLLLQLAELSGWKVSLAVVVVTGVLGAVLARSQGTRTLRRIQVEFQQGQMPSDALCDSALILVAAVLLLTPGVLTDVVAITMLLPWTRPWYKRQMLSWFKVRFRTFHSPAGAGGRSQVIDSYVIGPAADRKDPTDPSEGSSL